MRTPTRTALVPAVIAVVAAITACGSSGPCSSPWYQRRYQYGEGQ
jgi:predicted small lipoprotein YifL